LRQIRETISRFVIFARNRSDIVSDLSAESMEGEMTQTRPTVEEDARARASQTLADGKPIMDKALLIRCAEEIERLKAALQEIAAGGPSRGGVWARNRAEQVLERDD
jgi:hypothetical protein